MKLINLLFLSVLLSLSVFVRPGLLASSCDEQDKNPLLVVVLMVKNEEDVICPTLQPFVDAGVESYLIFDTGSTDNTVDVVTYFLQSYSVDFFVEQEPFIDYSTSRNRALDLAQERFPDAVFFVMPDAEWYLKNAGDLLKFCVQHQTNTEAVYLIRIVSADLDFHVARLIRANSSCRFVGEIHEVPNYCAREKLPGHIFFELSPSHYGAEKSRRRWQERDLPYFERKYAENPFDTRNLFYYGQTLWCLGKLKEAHHIYKMRAVLRGWDEEDYLSWYRLGRITSQLAKVDVDYSWSEAMDYFLRAFSMRPSRAEPIIRIAEHYLEEDDHALGYLFALRASQIPYPETDILMVEKELYEYWRHEVLCRCAWYIGEYEVGFAAACKAKQRKPEVAHVQRNAQLFFDKLCEPLV